jgi:hypothetical protein
MFSAPHLQRAHIGIDTPSRILLTVIDNVPEAIERALSAA